MKKILHYALLGLLSLAVGACSSVNSSWSGSDSIRVAEPAAHNPDAPMKKYAASINLVPYRDARQIDNPHKIGISTQRVIGMSGTALMVDPEVSVVVSNSLRRRLDDAGFQLAAADALYELSGVVKELSYDVRERDEIYIVVESTLKERTTGKVVWSGIVVEKGDRFAGVSGNNKQDIANYLRAKVGVVTDKTTESISTSLMASRPDLFSLTPGTKPIAGVTVLQAPAAFASPADGTAIAVTPAHAAPAAANGLLLISSIPPRAKIYVDDVYYGLTPLRLELAVGVHNIRAAMARHKSSTEKVSVRKGETTEIEMELKR